MTSVVLLTIAFASGFVLALVVKPVWNKVLKISNNHRSPKNIINLPLRRVPEGNHEPLISPYRFHGLATRSRRVRELLKAAEIISATNSTVLVEGESGTGKELMARALHESGQRRGRPLVIVHAAAIPETLIEAELFGHEKGAFTGALEQRKGRFEAANGGTLFLDEVSDLSSMVQVKLLRVIQERSFERLGGNQTIPVDVRIVAASNKNMSDLVDRGRFREDLYYRLNVVALRLLPLRERKEDLPLLIEETIARHSQRIGKKISGYRDSFLQILTGHDFPGNIRELENIVERAIVFCDDSWLTDAHVRLREGNLDRGMTSSNSSPLDPFQKRIDYTVLIETYYKARGNKTMAARMMEIPESTYRYHLKKALNQETGDRRRETGGET